MFEIIRVHQVDFMLALSSVCLIIAFFTLINKIMSKRRKTILLILEIAAAIWLEADRVAYLYRGMPGVQGYWTVKISNFLVFLMTVTVLSMVSFYLDDVLKNEGGLSQTPPALSLAIIFGGIAATLVVISQFTGLYYIIDSDNEYQRSSLYLISYIFPYLILLIQFGVLIHYRKRLKGRIALSIFLFSTVSLTTSMIQIFAYGISLVDMAAVVMVIGLYVFALIEMNERFENDNKTAIDNLKGEQTTIKKVFEQTAFGFVAAIDAKDSFHTGHSARVAEYSREIARLSGMDEKRCNEAYFAGLLHDVGKLGVSDVILKKDVELTSEEYEELKKHSNIGGDILSQIDDMPDLANAARYHHERYDGKGYPEGLVGENIPELARIVAVADAYDSMTSNRINRETLPQSTVREEILLGAGSQFDPEFSEIMVNMIDHDIEYTMREKETVSASSDGVDLMSVGEMRCGEYKENVAEGIKIKDTKTIISFDCQPEIGFDEDKSIPAIILFDAFDGCFHRDDRSIRLINYLEFGEIWMDGNIIDTSARDMKVSVEPGKGDLSAKEGVVHYEIETVKIRDHVRVIINSSKYHIDVVAALPDAIRFCYVGLSGEHCHIMNFNMIEETEPVSPDYIPRIAEETSFIDRIEGDFPNIQVEGYRRAYTAAVPVEDGLRLRFRTMSLPTANLIWHCPFILLFSAEDGIPEGKNYLEHGCIRLDGENATNNDLALNEVEVHKDEDFGGWDAWKKANKKGYESEIVFSRRKHKITMETRNCGIVVKCITTVPTGYENVFVAITGDQVALTDIRMIKR